MPDSENGRAVFLGSLSFISALLISEVESMGEIAQLTTPAWVMNAVLVFHSLAFWSLFFSIVGSFVSYFWMVWYQISKIDIVVALSLWCFGILCFMVQAVLFIYMEGYGLRSEPWEDDYEAYYTASRFDAFLCYAIPQYTFYALLPLMVYYYYRFARNAQQAEQMENSNVDRQNEQSSTPSTTIQQQKRRKMRHRAR